VQENRATDLLDLVLDLDELGGEQVPLLLEHS